MGRYLLETIVLLVVMSALAIVVLFVARRAGLGAARGPIRLVGQLPLDPRRSVYLVQVASKVLVVGVAEGGMTKLGELDETDLPAPTPAASTAFRDVLARVLGKNAPEETQTAIPSTQTATPSTEPVPGGQGAEPPHSVRAGRATKQGAEPPHSVRAGRATREETDGS